MGKIQYDLEGVGLKPSIQDEVSVSAEVGKNEMFTVNFKNTTDSAIYCDLILKGMHLWRLTKVKPFYFLN